MTGTSVNALVIYNNQLVAAGNFTAAGGVACANIARWDGLGWQPLDGGVNGSVSSLAIYNDQLVAGGYFTTAGGVASKGVARWDGATWQGMVGGITSGTDVKCLTVYNGQLIVGGTFSAVGGVVARYVAAWTGTAWQAVGEWWTGSSYFVSALGVYHGELIAGGQFSNVGAVAAFNVARWDGNYWRPLTYGMNGAVRAVAVYKGELIAGGDFTITAGGPCSYIARRDAAGVWHPMAGGMNDKVYALGIYNDELIAAGWFTAAGGVACNRVARWDGSTWQPLGTGIGPAGAGVYALAVYNNQLIAAGNFTSAGGVPCARIAAWNGSSWQALGSGLNSTVQALAIYNNQLVVGGYFTTAGGVAALRIASWDGTAWQPVDGGITTGSTVNSLAIYNGDLIAAGDFTFAGGVSCSRIARWNGAAWSPLRNGLWEKAYTMTVFDGQLIVGGYFGIADGMTVNAIASWNGSNWAALSQGLAVSVYATTVHDGELIAGGDFKYTGDGKVSACWARWGPVMPEIRQQPVAQTVVQGHPASFSVRAIGAAPLTYQWRKNGAHLADGASISGAASASLTINPASLADEGSYDCVVTNGSGSATSSAASLTVKVPAAIVTQPVSVAVKAGETATFTVEATGSDGITYQWRKAGVALADDSRIAGSTTSTLIISAVEMADTDSYDVVVTNPWGTATSEAVTITVLPTIVTQPVGQTVTAGDPITLTVSAVGSGTLSYQWRKDGAAMVDGGNIAGAATATLSINPTQLADAGSYDVVVTSEYGAAASQAAVVTITVPITIVRQPDCPIVKVGDAATISVEAAGAGTLSYQWRKDGAALIDGGAISGATTSALTINPVALTDTGSYDVVISCAGASVTSLPGTLTIANSVATPAGSQVSLSLVDPNTGYSSVTVTFQNVTTPGITAVMTVPRSEQHTIPVGFKLGQPAVLYQLETTAVFSGTVEVCFDYGNIHYGNESRLRLFHLDNGAWVDVTTSRDTVNKKIYGQVTHFSLFGVFEEEEVPNTPPSVTITSPSTGYIQGVNNDVTLRATINDLDAGDTHTATWTIHDDYWGTQTVAGAVSGNTVQNIIQLSGAGIYHITITVTDAAGAIATTNVVNDDPALGAFVVIYDPTAGHVTGGGWIMSPAGALKWTPEGAATDATGKATFGFNAMYHKGATVPTGNTEFQFQAGDFRFKSTQYDWLVIAGNKAQYKGWGEISGLSGTYAFQLTGVDDSTGDRFRIRIWDETTDHVVYDNKRGQDDSAEPTLLAGGSIKIHK